jgi:hypothetical protein
MFPLQPFDDGAAWDSMDRDVLAGNTSPGSTLLQTRGAVEGYCLRGDAGRRRAVREPLDACADVTGLFFQLAPRRFVGLVVTVFIADKSRRKFDDACVHRAAELLDEDDAVVVSHSEDHNRRLALFSLGELPAVALEDE